MVYKKFSSMAHGSFKNAVKALQERFEPESHRHKGKTESWLELGEDLRVLVDKAYPTQDDEAQQQLALQRFLSQLDNAQVAFSIKQRKPKTIEVCLHQTDAL